MSPAYDAPETSYPPAPAAPTEEQARTEYARWFVREHYLHKETSFNWSLISKWLRAKEQGFVKFGKVQYPWSNEPTIVSEYWVDTSFSLTRPTLEPTWWQIAIEDLDLEINDGNIEVEHVRMGREECTRQQHVTYLLAEAEFHRVTNEAWLRSYGVDVSRP